MSFGKLAEVASQELFELEKFSNKDGRGASLDSIKNQIQFIHDAAIVGENPLEMVSSDSPFTFGILSSREFASPREMEVKERLDRVTAALSRI